MTKVPIAETRDALTLLERELALPYKGILAVLDLLAEGATVPFIARYRKEATGGLDEVQIRRIEERHTYLTELSARKKTVLAEIDKQGKLSDDLRRKILDCASKSELEDLYLPYKPKRRTRATIARERGLEPLAELMWTQSESNAPEQAALAFVAPEKDVPDAASALAGARDICAERIAEDADVRRRARQTYFERGSVRVAKAKDYAEARTKFDTYADYQEPIKKIPSHRYLAIRRGETEGVLKVSLEVDASEIRHFVERHVRLNNANRWRHELSQAIDDAIKRLLLPSVEVDVRVELKMQSDQAAIDIFAKNLRDLLLAAPLGDKAVLGIDPGQRTGCKCVVVDRTGKLVEHATVYLVAGDQKLEQARRTLRDLCRRHPLTAIGVGNGTHGRETEAFVREVLVAEGLEQVFCVAVNEAGASVYSASDIAREEFPELDVSIRGAISIARRLQDPLSELVKIDPKSIGVGQYQHDVYQPFLAKKLDDVVESCVNTVGVEMNTASAPLLSRVAGLGPALAKKIVSYRNLHGPFGDRKSLLRVQGLGPRTFEQAAGFLRVRGGSHPLDASAVHPERYALVEKMAADLGVPVASLIGNKELLRRIDRKRYEGGDVGSYTLDDILSELDKPGRDPRARFEPPSFREDVRKLEDVKAGMQLEGVVTNVTAFGAFVDVGVHQDGLVHISELADRFVRDPSEVVKAGDRLRVTVLEVDLERGRIALSARTQPPKQGQQKQGQQKQGPADARGGRANARDGSNRERFANNPFATHFKK